MDYLTKITSERPRPSRAQGQRNLVEETESNRGRIIQSAALRRLQQKTQVYPLETNASVRSRLTHSLEVQETGRYLAKTILAKFKESNQLKLLGLESIEIAFTNLVEMSCLLHDVGNPPFGHFGEAAFSLWMQKYTSYRQKKDLENESGGSALFREVLLPDLCVFDGNAQGLRIIHSLQELNLTWSQLASTLKYTRAPFQLKSKVPDHCQYRQKKPGFYYSEQSVVSAMKNALSIDDNCRFPLVYIMEAADDISFCISDLEDAVDKGILSFRSLQRWLKEVWMEFSGSSNHYLLDIIQSSMAGIDENSHIFITKLRTRLVNDLVDYAANRYLHKHQEVFDGTLDEPLIDGGSDQHLALETLKTVAIRHVFNSHEKETPELRGYAALMGLLDIYRPILELSRSDFMEIVDHDNSKYFLEQRLYHRLPGKYIACYRRDTKLLFLDSASGQYSQQERNDLEWYYRARLILDYISGMTDHFVLNEYQSLSAI